MNYKQAFAVGLIAPGVWGVVNAGAKLSDYSWSEISTISKAGNAASTFALGDTKDITLTTGEVITVQIIGFNHDALSDGTGTAGITFCMRHNMATKTTMNNTNTNVGGWKDSVVRGRLQPSGDIYATLPTELTASIQPVQKLTSVGDLKDEIETTEDYCFLLSEVEVFGMVYYSFAGEGKQYAIYAEQGVDTGLLAKRLSNGAGNLNDWLGRSPAMALTTDNYNWYFCCFGAQDVLAGTTRANFEKGLSFAFCV